MWLCIGELITIILFLSAREKLVGCDIFPLSVDEEPDGIVVCWICNKKELFMHDFWVLLSDGGYGTEEETVTKLSLDHVFGLNVA